MTECQVHDLARQSRVARLQIEAAWRVGLLVVSAIGFWEAAMLAERDRI